MLNDKKALAWMREHHKCGCRYTTSAWFGLQWADCKDYVNVKCNGCGEVYIEERSEIESNGSAPEPETKNFPKREKHEKSISTRKIGKWKIRSS